MSLAGSGPPTTAAYFRKMLILRTAFSCTAGSSFLSIVWLDFKKQLWLSEDFDKNHFVILAFKHNLLLELRNWL